MQKMELINLQDTVAKMAHEFSASLKFNDINVMRGIVDSIEANHQEENCDECSSWDYGILKHSNVDISVAISNLSVCGNNLSRVSHRTSTRKSRKSVCVAPLYSSSSEESSGDESNHINGDSGETPIMMLKFSTDDEDEEIFIPKRKPKIKTAKMNFISSDSEKSILAGETDTDESFEVEKESFVIHSDKEIYINESNHSCNDNSMIKTKTKKGLAISNNEDEREEISDTSNQKAGSNDDDTNEETGEKDDDNSLILYKERNVLVLSSSEGEENREDNNKVKKAVNATDEEIESDKNAESSEEGNFDNFVGAFKNVTCNTSDENERSGDSDINGSLNDFIVDDSDDSLPEVLKISKKTKTIAEQKVKSFATPKPFATPKLHATPKRFVTPRSATKEILDRHKTPNVPGTPAYKRSFNKLRDNVVKELFQLYNRTVFDNKLPQDFSITWNKRMTKTAGFCYYSMSMNVCKSRIELSDKVIDCTERVRDTLIHELCHAATWIIDGKKAGHGPAWKYWAKKANKVHPDIPVISRCHQYDIHTKFNYQCNGCGQMYGRHSKSIDEKRHRCSKCGGIPELVTPSVSATPKTPNHYAMFVKENFASVKKANAGLFHKEIMLKISEQFKAFKFAEETKENRLNSF